MKKIVLFTVGALVAGNMMAQNCLSGVDQSATTLGFVPNPIVGATETVPYDEVITIVLPQSVDNNGVQIPLCAIGINSVSGLPAGYTYEIWARVGGTGADYDVLATNADTISIDQVNPLTRACLRLKNPNPAAPSVTPIDSVPITVIVGAWANIIGCQDLTGAGGTDTFIVKLPIKSSVFVGIENEMDGTNNFAVYSNFPNPATGSTTLSYTTPSAGKVTISLFDAVGRMVRNINLTSKQGLNTYVLETGSLQTGVYMYNVTFNGKTMTKKMIVNN